MADACAWCGNPFVRIHAAKRKYCCDTCKAAACKARAELDGRAEQWRKATAERARRQPDSVACRQCGETFERRHANRIYCSTACRSKAYHAASYQREQRRRQFADAAKRRRARKRGATAERFTSVEIYERDGWICQLCGVPVDRTVKVPAYLAPTIDHVTPLAAGGMHTRANVQTAHFICNSRKSDRMEAVANAWSGSEAPIDARTA